MNFDAAAYWADKQFKKWVVSLESGSGYNTKTEIRYVSAEEESGAAQCAMDHSNMPNARATGVKLATPDDLGCVPS